MEYKYYNFFFRISWSFLCFENKANYKQLAWKEQRQANDADRTNQFRIKQSINGIKINQYDNALLMSGVFPKRTWGKSNPFKAKAEFHLIVLLIHNIVRQLQ